jgi:hypothetical protein
MGGVQDWNYPEFFKVATELRALGYEVINPAENNGVTLEEAIKDVGSLDNPTQPWDYYIRKDLKTLADADAICMLPDWQISKGANLEHTIAKALKMPVYIYRDGKLKPRIEVIGISGYARSGKDTIAEKLTEVGYIRGSFADAIRESLYRLNPNVVFEDILDGVYSEPRLKNIVDVLGWDEAKSEPEIRRLLQVFGTEVGREMFGDNFWVDYLFNSLPDGAKVVIPDVRYPNEANAITELGGAIWRVEREGVKAVNNHISDSAMDDYPFKIIVYNNGTIEELYDWVETELHYEA